MYNYVHTEEINKIVLSSNDDKRLQTFDRTKNKKEHKSKWPCISDHPYRILIIGASGSGKANALLNLINNQLDIDKTYLDAKDPYEAKYQYLINKC